MPTNPKPVKPQEPEWTTARIVEFVQKHVPHDLRCPITEHDGYQCNCFKSVLLAALNRTAPAQEWRMLAVGEVIREGDEWQRGEQEWLPCGGTIGATQLAESGPVRRRVLADTPANLCRRCGKPLDPDGLCSDCIEQPPSSQPTLETNRALVNLAKAATADAWGKCQSGAEFYVVILEALRAVADQGRAERDAIRAMAMNECKAKQDAWDANERLTKERDGYQSSNDDLQIQLRNANERSQMWHDRRKAAEIERDQLRADLQSVRDHMALACKEAGCPNDETLVIHCRELRAENERLRLRLLSAAGDDLCRLSSGVARAGGGTEGGTN